MNTVKFPFRQVIFVPLYLMFVVFAVAILAEQVVQAVRTPEHFDYKDTTYIKAAPSSFNGGVHVNEG